MPTIVHQKRIPSLDFAKGLAIIAVILGHSKWSSEELVWFIYTWHMPLFFLLAGFTFKRKTFNEVLSRAFQRLLVPYFVVCLVVGIRFSIHGGFYSLWDRVIATLWAIGGKHPWTRYCPDVPIVGAIWFLPALFWCRIAFHLISRYRYKYLIAMIIALVATYIDSRFIVLPLSFLEGLSALSFFSIGCLVAQYQQKLCEYRCWFIPIGLCCWCWQLSHPQISMVICRYMCYPVDVIGACFASWCIVTLSKYCCRFIKASAIIIWMGLNSLAVLCMHNFETFCFNYASLQLPSDSFLLLLLRFGIIFSLVYLLSYLPIARRVFGISRLIP